MKKPLQTIFSFLFALSLFFSGCTDQQQQETANESQEAVNDFRTFVEETETRAEQTFDDTERNWDQEMTDWETSYSQKEAELEGNMAQYDEQTKAEINELKERYNTAWTRTENNYNAYKQNREMRENLLGVDVKTDELTEITADNIQAKYESFVSKVKEDAANYSRTQWDHVEGFWGALNNRMNALENEIDEEKRNAIRKSKESYQEIRKQYMNLSAD